MQQAEELLREGRVEDALAELQQQVRDNPAQPELRIFLFQLLSVLGRWDRALTQLNVAAEMDGEKLLLAKICQPALQCEAFRSAVFRGEKAPVVFGEPEEWVGWLIRANEMLAEKEYAAALELRDRAFEAAPAVSGTVNGEPFEWFCDMDTRLGPVLEVILGESYYWVPMTRIVSIRIEEPKALRNMIWAEAQFTWTNGGQAPGLIPARYAGSEAAEDGMLRLGRRTDWTELEGGHLVGLGQRMFATDSKEYPMLEVRNVTLANAMQAPEAPAEGEAQPPADAGEGDAASDG